MHSLIELVEMCKQSDYNSSLNNDIRSITTRKFLALKNLTNHKASSINWLEKISLKHKAIMDSYKLITQKSESIKINSEQQKNFMQALQKISRKWKIARQGNILYVSVGKNFQGEDCKVLLFKEPSGLRVELSQELKKMKILKVTVKCLQVSLPEICVPGTFEFPELEKAENLVSDTEIFKNIQENLCENENYTVYKYTKQEIELSLNVRVKQVRR